MASMPNDPISGIPIQRKYVFHGRVQGVGFRMTTAAIAKRFPVVGYVKNLPDDTVELVVCGLTSDIAALLAEIDRAFPGHVSKRETSEIDASADFTSFTIRH